MERLKEDSSIQVTGEMGAWRWEEDVRTRGGAFGVQTTVGVTWLSGDFTPPPRRGESSEGLGGL